MENTELIQRAMLGDAPAMEALISMYYDAVYAFCCRKAGDNTLGADICQETFIKLVRYLPQYRERGYFKSWLFTIASNCCKDAFRRQQPAEELTDALPDKAQGPEERTENAEMLKHALGELPEEQREAVILRYYHDFSLKEIAKVQGVPSATAKTRVHRGLKKLRALIPADDEIA